MDLLTVGTVLVVGSLVGIVTLGLPPFTAFAIMTGMEFGFAAAVHSDAVEPSTTAAVEVVVEIEKTEGAEVEIAEK